MQASHHDDSYRLPITTSDSYPNCLIEENSERTGKFWLARDVLKVNKTRLKTVRNSKYSNRKAYLKLTELDLSTLVKLEMSHFLPYNKLSGLLFSPLQWKTGKHELYFEYLSLNYNLEASNFGFMLYRLENKITKNTIVRINAKHISDYALLMCNLNQTVLTINRFQETVLGFVDIKLPYDCGQFDVLVDNVGRLSDMSHRLDQFSNERKGILTRDAIVYKQPGKVHFQIGGIDWKVYFLDFGSKFFNRVFFNSEWNAFDSIDRRMGHSGPLLTYAKFNVEKIKNKIEGDMAGNGTAFRKGIYLLIPDGWSRGVVFLNGFNLGRYWNVGPLRTMFVPEFLLLAGRNEIIFFELNHTSSNSAIYLTHTHVYL